MSEIRITINGISMEAVGQDDLIRREREAFLCYIEKHKEIQAGLEAISAEKLNSTEHENCKCSCISDNLAEETDNNQIESIDVVRTVKHHQKMNWQVLAEEIKKGRTPVEVGAIVSCELKDGTLTEFVVTDVTDQYVRFETKNFIGEEVKWNCQDTTSGGYPISDIREYIDTTIWDLLPDDLQAVISDAYREWIYLDGTSGIYTTKLFLPAASEVCDEDCKGDYGVYKQLDYYKDARNRIRVDENGDTCTWWLSSVASGSSIYACGVDDAGDVDRWHACNSNRVPICFLISKTS